MSERGVILAARRSLPVYLVHFPLPHSITSGEDGIWNSQILGSSSFEVHSKFKRNRLFDREITLPTLPNAVQIGPTVGELWRDRRVLRYVRVHLSRRPEPAEKRHD
jgi:hypothetical protein